MTKFINMLVVAAIILFTLPGGAFAQDGSRSYERERAPDWPRGRIQVTNDWRDEVNVTMWTHRRERIGDSWAIESGSSAVLTVDGYPVKVRPSYKIKVGDDWGWVELGKVGRFRRGTWYVNVRDIWRATHQRRSGRDDDQDDSNVPDWQR